MQLIKLLSPKEATVAVTGLDRVRHLDRAMAMVRDLDQAMAMAPDRVRDLDQVTAKAMVVAEKMEDMDQVTVLAKEMGQAVGVQANVNLDL